jgi:DNA-binding transcriptional MerR regulator
MEKSIHIKDGRTVLMLDEVERCEDIDDLQAILNKNSRYFTDWKAFINNLVNVNGYSYRLFAKKCGMSHNTVASWCEKGLLPRSRDQFIRLGFGLGMSLEEMNEFLQRYGKYPRLYTRNIEDAIFIFALDHSMTYKAAISLQDRFRLIMENTPDVNAGDQTPNGNYETMYLQSKLLSLHDVKQFEVFVSDNISAFLSSYQKLISFIDDYIKVNTLDFTDDDPQASLNGFLRSRIKNPGLINHYNKMISKLRSCRVVPKRNALVVLGVYLDMSLGDVNQMLTMAGMEPLCAKDKVECIIIYAIESAILNNPDIEFSNALLLKNFTENPETRENCRKIISMYEMNEYISKEEDGGVINYVLEALRQFDPADVSEISSLIDE